jgi:AcrR family transcriptional regulator
VGSRKAGKTHAEARERSRQALFRAGAEMLTEGAARDPFAAIRIRELCRRADYSTGAFYAHWPNADAFYAELTEYFMANILSEDFDELMVHAREAAAQPGAAGVLDLAELDITTLLANPHWDAVELLNLTLARTSHREPAAAGYRDIDALTGEMYATALAPLGREPRPPLTWAHVGAALQALIEGFGFRAKVDPKPAELRGQHPRRLYAYAVAGLLVSLTRPHDDRRGLRESLDDELA